MPETFGDHLRAWRQRRRMSQMDLALEAEISTRHLSFLETGRAQPSREMVLNLSERLETPLRERNRLLVAAGFAPVYPERDLGDVQLAAARRAVELILAAHMPYPALAADRAWNLVAANPAALALMEGVPPSLLGPPPNVMRVGLHPDGLMRRTVNPAEWRRHLIERLRRQVAHSADPVLADLLDEVSAYPTPPAGDRRGDDLGGLAVPLRLVDGDRVLSFISTTTVFGDAVDVTLAELTLETFFPADPETATALANAAAST
ncbi:helix-turn-helix transcriptional regulator [Caulobacter endophyticus]|uniref:helix-turn-helix transcriptional regulator n=1 Tax=Caulobacter endophyticus TaxID=2172652 RepID=UPI0024106AEF|nr:helix-turn-helix transcriptional regulator [Caulobacter endophyticus]MDG2528426.1 helix-turn-helix transcriptional regulator [Caulobacter endophyticus]